jgi:hypothetical protein
MARLDPVIHVPLAWIPGSSPGMTVFGNATERSPLAVLVNRHPDDRHAALIAVYYPVSGKAGQPPVRRRAFRE